MFHIWMHRARLNVCGGRVQSSKEIECGPSHVGGLHVSLPSPRFVVSAVLRDSCSCSWCCCCLQLPVAGALPSQAMAFTQPKGLAHAVLAPFKAVMEINLGVPVLALLQISLSVRDGEMPFRLMRLLHSMASRVLSLMRGDMMLVLAGIQTVADE
eukprot:5884847-Amphidinium_carterae.1